MKKFISIYLLFIINNSFSNYCTPISFYDSSSLNTKFQLITITTTIKNNHLSYDNRKFIKNKIALSINQTTNSAFKILVIHKNSLIPSKY